MWRGLFAVLFFVVIFEIPIALAESQQCDAVVAKSSAVSVSNPVNINTATAEMLSTQLKGIGKAKAAAIIEWRETNGKFSSLDDLDEVKGIGAGIIEKNKDKIVFKD
jgi:competence protein ComEA